jgi:hypothetical protein
VLFAAGFYAAGNQLIHFLTAADGMDTGVMDHFNGIAAMGANIILIIHNSFLQIDGFLCLWLYSIRGIGKVL